MLIFFRAKPPLVDAGADISEDFCHYMANLDDPGGDLSPLPRVGINRPLVENILGKRVFHVQTVGQRGKLF